MITDWKLTVHKAFLKLGKYYFLTMCSGRPFQVETTLSCDNVCENMPSQFVSGQLSLRSVLVRVTDPFFYLTINSLLCVLGQRHSSVVGYCIIMYVLYACSVNKVIGFYTPLM